MLGFEYKYSDEFIWSLSYREIDWKLKAIHSRRRQETSVQAAMHGIEIPRDLTDEEETETVEVSPEMEAAIKEQYAKTFAEKKKALKHGR